MQVEVNEKQLRNLTILNTGKFNFDYQWELHMSNKKKEMVTIEPMTGGVENGKRVNCKLTFCPPCRTTLKDTQIVLKVRGFCPPSSSTIIEIVLKQQSHAKNIIIFLMPCK